MDKDLKFYDQRISAYPNSKFFTENPQVFVIEIKAEEKDERYLNKFLKDFPFSASRFSKYCESLNLRRHMIS